LFGCSVSQLKHASQVILLLNRTVLTLEVSHIGRHLAQALGANEDLVESISYAHDLGMPPFGQAGEATLAHLMHDHGGFDHNKQTIRLVTELERLSQSFPGLNLTWEVREGIVKHESEYDAADATNLDPELRGHLEAQILNAANDIAILAFDLDDGLKSGIITPNQLEGIELWKQILVGFGKRILTLSGLERHQVIHRLIELEVSDLVETTLGRLQESGVRSVKKLQSLPYNVVSNSKSLHRQNWEIKRSLYEILYRHYDFVRSQHRAEIVLTGLFEALVRDPGMLPPRWRDQLEHSTVREPNAIKRVVCDYIAGMTDRFAIEEHRKVTAKESVVPRTATRIEEKETPSTKLLRCFLSYRFSDKGKSYAREVGHFLEMQGVEVLTGEMYEPRGISQKVKELLAKDLDFVVLIVAEDGESAWTHDEIATARAEKKVIIPLVVEGSKFQAGLSGDTEWIPFASGHVGDTLTKLSEGINYVRKQISGS